MCATNIVSLSLSHSICMYFYLHISISHFTILKRPLVGEQRQHKQKTTTNIIFDQDGKETLFRKMR